jgi:hypothetical protein
MKTCKVHTPAGPRRTARSSFINRFSAALLLMCRLIHDEAASFPFELNTFVYIFHVFEKLLYRQPAVQRQHVKNVMLKIRMNDSSVEKLLGRGFEFKALFPSAVEVIVVAEKAKVKWSTPDQRKMNRDSNVLALEQWLAKGNLSVRFEE